MRAPSRACCISVLRTNALTFLTILGVVGGVILGVILRETRETRWTPREVMYVNFIGELFLRMLKALILPLIVASLVSAIGSLDLSLSRKIGGQAIAYYITTTVLAVIQGIILVMTIKPGKGGKAEEIPTAGAGYVGTTEDTLLDLVRKMFPPNIIQACVYNDRTVLIPPTIAANATASPEDLDIYTWQIKQVFVEGMNIMGLVVFATVLGIALGRMGEKGKPLLDVFTSLSQAMMVITKWVIWLAPVGVMFLITAELLRMSSFSVIVGQLGMYTVTVLVGIIFHGFVVLPVIYTLLTRKSPFAYIANMAQALATAFSTASSSATLPVAISSLEDKNGIDPRVSRFVMPIGATINMDGTALYEAVGAIFIAQVRDVPLSIGNIIAISITATLASIGAAGIPQAGLITMVMVLDTVGLPAEDVTLILAVDWLLDRFRTMVNVLGDSLGAGIVSHFSKAELENLQAAESTPNLEYNSNNKFHRSDLTIEEKL